jgi:hypothetical protein
MPQRLTEVRMMETTGKSSHISLPVESRVAIIDDAINDGNMTYSID